ncbi:hypothetical protein [Bradyrhizobium sp. AS23.2]|uniref:hypothetical protein n=1 Tax=Bradyrhizobium sp. AS23.2 TaxID=1680155 RepID=UPI00094008C5|nr:hypothetical protein [Bradyrhizobium sp. AS23.2]OKO71888.1 hypothetical protein AC630_31735 [Bradyrhizobium sp. AS23.2]
MMTRDEQVRELANGIKIEARLVALRRLAEETARAYDALVRHGAPEQAALDFFACCRLLQRLDEERGSSGNQGDNVTLNTGTERGAGR